MIITETLTNLKGELPIKMTINLIILKNLINQRQKVLLLD